MVNELFADADEYQNYRITKKSTGYDDESTSKLKKMNKKTAVQMKNRTSFYKHSLSVIIVLQDFNIACGCWNIHDGATMKFLKHYLVGPIRAVIKVSLAREKETAKLAEWFLT